MRRVRALAGRVESMELALAGRGGKAPSSAGLDLRTEAEGGREEAAREGGRAVDKGLAGRDDATREASTQRTGAEAEAARLR